MKRKFKFRISAHHDRRNVFRNPLPTIVSRASSFPLRLRLKPIRRDSHCRWPIAAAALNIEATALRRPSSIYQLPDWVPERLDKQWAAVERRRQWFLYLDHEEPKSTGRVDGRA